MKKNKLLRTSVIISSIIVGLFLVIYIASIAIGLFVPGFSMSRFENRPHLEMQVTVDNERMANVRIYNRSENGYSFGEMFALYRRFGCGWRRVLFRNELTDGVDWLSMGFSAPPNSYGEPWPIDLYQRFGELSAGEYRIVKAVRGVTEIRVADGFVLD